VLLIDDHLHSVENSDTSDEEENTLEEVVEKTPVTLKEAVHYAAMVRQFALESHWEMLLDVESIQRRLHNMRNTTNKKQTVLHDFFNK
jgi:hypothetical protein